MRKDAPSPSINYTLVRIIALGELCFVIAGICDMFSFCDFEKKRALRKDALPPFNKLHTGAHNCITPSRSLEQIGGLTFSIVSSKNDGTFELQLAIDWGVMVLVRSACHSDHMSQEPYLKPSRSENLKK